VRGQRTSVGLDVHARSVVGCGLDGETGELFERRLTPAHGGVLSWVRSLPGPVAVTYEAGPTGFGLARFLVAAPDTLIQGSRPGSGSPAFTGGSFGITVPSLLITAAALPHVTGSPGPRVLRRLRPFPTRSVDDGPNRRSVLAARPSGKTGKVPVFTAVRSTKEESSCAPAASPWLTRSTSPWPPGRHPQDHPGVTPTSQNTTGKIAHRTRPISARFGAGKPLRT